MNNSLQVDLDPDFLEETSGQELLREREAKLVRMIEALAALSSSNEWSTLKDELFDGALESIESKIRSEADRPELNLPELYRLQGERKWAKRYADPKTLVGNYRRELANIRNQLTPGGGAP